MELDEETESRKQKIKAAQTFLSVGEVPEQITANAG